MGSEMKLQTEKIIAEGKRIISIIINWYFGQVTKVKRLLSRIATWLNCVILCETITGVATAVTAIATIVLALVTGQYVGLTSRLVAEQKRAGDNQARQLSDQGEQFRLVNSPKVVCRDLLAAYGIEGDVKKANLLFTNSGNLPASDFKIIWKIFVVPGDDKQEMYPSRLNGVAITTLNKKEMYKHANNIDSAETIKVQVTSDFEPREQVVFLAVAWKYKGQGIDGYCHPRVIAFLWNNQQKDRLPYWVQSPYLDNKHIGAITDTEKELIDELSREN